MGINTFEVFENFRPARFDCINWRDNKFNTLEEAQKYAQRWVGSHYPLKQLKNGVPYNYYGNNTIVIKEIP